MNDEYKAGFRAGYKACKAQWKEGKLDQLSEMPTPMTACIEEIKLEEDAVVQGVLAKPPTHRES